MIVGPETTIEELEQRRIELEKDIASQESWVAALELCVIWQNTVLSRVRDHFHTASNNLLQHKDLALTESTWPQYQFMTCDALSSIDKTVNAALLAEVQVLSSRFPEREFPYPAKLEEACSCLRHAVDASIQRTLSLEEKARVVQEEHAAAEAENAELTAKLQALQTDSETDLEFCRARRVPVVRAVARPTTIRTTR